MKTNSKWFRVLVSITVITICSFAIVGCSKPTLIGSEPPSIQKIGQQPRPSSTTNKVLSQVDIAIVSGEYAIKLPFKELVDGFCQNENGNNIIITGNFE